MAESDTQQEKRERILRAALAAYERYGIAEATTRQIAELAGIGKSTIFEYFKNSAELMDEAFAYFIGQTNARWQQLHNLAESHPVAALAAYFDGTAEMVREEPGKLLLITQYITTLLARHRESREARAEYTRKLQPMADKLLEEFQYIAARGMELGHFAPAAGMDAGDCALLISAMAREMQSHALTADETAIADSCQRLKRMAFRLLGIESDII